MNKKGKWICRIAGVLLVGLAFFAVRDDVIYHPKVLVAGDNPWKLGSYRLEKSGLADLEKIIARSEDLPKSYTIAYFEATVDQGGKIQSFTLSLDTFDENDTYSGTAGYSYAANTLTYTKPQNLLLEQTGQWGRGKKCAISRLTAGTAGRKKDCQCQSVAER